MHSSPIKAYHPRWGWLCIFLGLYPIAFAFKLFPTGDTSGYAPMWIIFLCGLAFVAAGTVILVKRHSRINTLLVTSILLVLGSMGVWVTLFARDGWFVGGFTALNEDQNIVLARWMYGIGAIASFIMSGYGIQKFLLSLIHPYGRHPHPPAGKDMPPGPLSPRPENPRPENPRSVTSRPVTRRRVRRRARPGLLRQLLSPGQSIQRRYRLSKGKSTRSPQSRQSNRRRLHSRQTSEPPRRP